VVTDVGRVAEEQRGAGGRGQADGAVVGDQDARAGGEAGGGQVGAGGGGGAAVGVDTDEGGGGEGAGGGEQEARGATAGVDDADRRDRPGGRPGDHGVDQRRRGVDGAEGAALLRRAGRRQGVAQRIGAGSQRVAEGGAIHHASLRD